MVRRKTIVEQNTRKSGKTECKATRAAGLAAIFLLALFLLCACAGPLSSPKTAPPASLTPPPAATKASPMPSGPAATVSQTQEASKTPEATPAASTPAAGFTGQAVCIKAATVYTGPKEGAGIVGKLKAGDTVDAAEYTGAWIQVSSPGIAGFVRQENLVGKWNPASVVPEGGWAEILVNQSHLLPAGFTVSPADFAGGQVDTRILAICGNMFADAKKDGAELVLVDAYRSRELQSELFEQKVQTYIAKGYSRSDAEKEAATITARPDTSEHQTGLALDVVTPAHTSRDSGFAKTRAFAWLNVNAANYGFILRYGQDKEKFTGVIYEPWHWRFVGVQAAQKIKVTGQSLEEYLKKTS